MRRSRPIANPKTQTAGANLRACGLSIVALFNFRATRARRYFPPTSLRSPSWRMTMRALKARQDRQDRTGINRVQPLTRISVRRPTRVLRSITLHDMPVLSLLSSIALFSGTGRSYLRHQAAAQRSLQVPSNSVTRRRCSKTIEQQQHPSFRKIVATHSTVNRAAFSRERCFMQCFVHRWMRVHC